MSARPAPALVWFRNDLRLSDHAPLSAASEENRPVVCVFVLDEEAAGAWRPGGAAKWWLHHSLAALSESLSQLGGRLILRRGAAARELAQIAAETGAEELHTGNTAEPWSRKQEARVAETLGKAGVRFVRHRTSMLFDQNQLRTRSGAPFQVYSPFARACLASGGPPPPMPAPSRLRGPAKLPRSDELAAWRLLPTKPEWAGGLRATWQAGEKVAREKLERFVASGLTDYATRRDRPDVEGTSRLSPHLRWGEISPAQVWHATANIPGGKAAKFIGELLWREFCTHLLWHHPRLPEEPLRPAFVAMRWRRDEASLRAWQRGQTGIPIVDAGMRQLWETGWMHNRVRLIAASFLVKHLLIDWREGEAWFWDTLVDADLANNSASWQWVAGCGADAAPFFRIFNPVLQARKFDPDGHYIRRFVPELARLPAPLIHLPSQASEIELRAAGVELGRTYPKPMVDLARGRARALAAFAEIGVAPAA